MNRWPGYAAKPIFAAGPRRLLTGAGPQLGLHRPEPRNRSGSALPRGTAARKRRFCRCFRRSVSALSATEVHKKRLLYQNTQRAPRGLQDAVIQPAAQKPDSPKQRHEKSRNPHSSPRAATSRSGRAKKGTFGAEFPSSHTWGQEAAKNQMDSTRSWLSQLIFLFFFPPANFFPNSLLMRELGRQRGKQALPSSGTLFCGCQSPQKSGWPLVGTGGRDGGSWGHWVSAEGDGCRPHLAQGWPEASSLHPVLLPAKKAPGRQSWRRNHGIALPLLLVEAQLRALTQNLGLQHERLKNLWGLCPGNQIFCLINP